LNVESVLNLEEARLSDLLQHYASIIRAPDGSVDVNRPGDTGGNRAIHAASFENNSTHVMALIALGADINVQNFDGLTALACACTVGAMSCIELLLAAGADVDICDHANVHPCHRVAASKCFRILPKLLKASKNGVNAVSSNGRLPLHDAAYHNSVECMIPLLHKGGDVGCKVPLGYPGAGCSPAHFAAQQNCSDAIKYLWLKKADLDAKDAKGNTALHFAAHHSSCEVVALLVEFGADASVKNADGKLPSPFLLSAPFLLFTRVLMYAHTHASAFFIGAFFPALAPLVVLFFPASLPSSSSWPHRENGS
jgi:ankyrin repeat protein